MAHGSRVSHAKGSETAHSLQDELPKTRDFKDSPGTLGTFLGVFTPTILTILGVIMYRRFGWVIGNVGLFQAMVILAIANAITISTTLSFSAIATNTRVGVGGAYFIISRSLGLEIGGAIGVPLFLSQVFSVTVYGFGLAESLQLLMPFLPVGPTTALIIVGVGAVSMIGADKALRAQIPIMVFIGISIFALIGGYLLNGPLPSDPALSAHMEQVPRASFWTVFAVFFPAVTGVMAGLGLSGDLKDPRKAIPRGSLSAVLAGLGVYALLLIVLASAADSALLRADTAALQGSFLEGREFDWSRIALWGPILVYPGMWGAIFSSAVGSMLGAPRTLQAIVHDHAAPNSWLTRLAGAEGKEPVAGLILSLVLALVAVSLGDLDAVAQVVTMLFLTVYGAVNFVAALETLAGSATWRPTLSAPWPLSLGAGVACIVVMFIIDPRAGIAAVIIEVALWFVFRRLERSTDWGDMRRDLYEALIRWALIRLKTRPMTARNWRPHIMVFARNIARRLNLVHFAADLSQGRGVVTVCELVRGDILDSTVNSLAKKALTNNRMLESQGLVAFSEVNVTQDFKRGVLHMAQANGMAGLHSNTVMFGWPDEIGRLSEILSLARPLAALHKSLIIARPLTRLDARQGKARTIHVWWGGLQRNGDLMLLLAYFLSRNPAWRRAKIEVLGIASNEITQHELKDQLDEMLPETRINASTRVLTRGEQQSVRDVIHEQSAGADVVFLGLGTPEEGAEEDYAQRLQALADGLQTCFFVKNASIFSGKLMEG